MREVREYRGVTHSIPSTDSGTWHYKIHPGHMRADAPRPQVGLVAGYESRAAAIEAAEEAIDEWLFRKSTQESSITTRGGADTRAPALDLLSEKMAARRDEYLAQAADADKMSAAARDETAKKTWNQIADNYRDLASHAASAIKPDTP